MTNVCALRAPLPPPLYQLGTFRSPEGEYFVEPLHSYQGEHYEEEHTKPHIVYRKTAAKKRTAAEEEESSACDASGSELSCVDDSGVFGIIRVV